MDEHVLAHNAIRLLIHSDISPSSLTYIVPGSGRCAEAIWCCMIGRLCLKLLEYGHFGDSVKLATGLDLNPNSSCTWSMNVKPYSQFEFGNMHLCFLQRPWHYEFFLCSKGSHATFQFYAGLSWGSQDMIRLRWHKWSDLLAGNSVQSMPPSCSQWTCTFWRRS